MKDIDRYLLTGKLGRHVTKTKPKDLDSSDVKLDIKLNALKQEASKKKKLLKSNGMKKSSVAAQGQKSAGNSSPKSSSKASKKGDMGVENTKETPEKKISTRPPKGKTSRSSRKREATPFFILDPDQCEEGSAASIPNLSEIIDSMQKEREGHNTVYISAPAIGALLGGQFQKTRIEHNYYKKPQFSLTFCRDYKTDFSPSMVSTFQAKKGALESSRNIINPNQDPSHDPQKIRGMVEAESKDKQVPGIQPVFGDLLTDPCIDFAIKTLTGSIPLGSEPAEEDCYFQQQLGSPMVLRQGSSCQN